MANYTLREGKGEGEKEGVLIITPWMGLGAFLKIFLDGQFHTELEEGFKYFANELQKLVEDTIIY